jgi:hypothetical protein
MPAALLTVGSTETRICARARAAHYLWYYLNFWWTWAATANRLIYKDAMVGAPGLRTWDPDD